MKNQFYVTNYIDQKKTEVYIYDAIGIKSEESPGYYAIDLANALKGVPDEHEVSLRINSCGGSLPHAKAMCALLKERKGHLTCYVDGICFSAATLLACCCDKVKMSRGGLMMIHNPQAAREGDAKVFGDAIKILNAYKEEALDIYEEKTGIERNVLSEMMDKMTFLNCDEAKAYNFVNEIIDEKVAAWQPVMVDDETIIEKVPEEYRKLFMCNNKKDPEPLTGNDPTKTGGTATNMQGVNTTPSGPKTVEPATTAPAQTVKAEPTNILDNSGDLAAMKLEIERLKQIEAERQKSEVLMLVESAITEGRIENSRKEVWVNRIMKDPTMKEDLMNLPAKNQTVPPIQDQNPTVYQTSTSMDDIVNQFTMCQNSRDFDGRTKLLSTNSDFLRGAIASNAITIHSDLKQAYIETNYLLESFFPDINRLLAGFATVWDTVPRKGTDEIVIAKIPAPSDGDVTNYDASTGLKVGGAAETQATKITLNKHKEVNLDYSLGDLAKMPFDFHERHVANRLFSLKKVFIADVMSCITAANFASVITAAGVAAADFDLSEIVKARTACNTSYWPEDGRNLYLNTDLEGALLNDTSLATWSALANEVVALTKFGKIPMLMNFNPIFSPLIPTNSERMAGFVCLKDAVGVAGAPYLADDGYLSKVASYEIIKDPASNISIGKQVSCDARTRITHVNYEILYGYAKLNGDSLKRFVTPAPAP